MTADRDREAFEAAFKAHNGVSIDAYVTPYKVGAYAGWQAARAQAGEPVAAASWTREDLAAGLAELDGIELAPPLQSVVDLEYLNRADDLLTFLSVASVANQPLGTAHPAPAQEPVAVPAGFVLAPMEPTWGLDAMSGAGAEQIPTEIGQGAAGQMACDVYRAMIAKRPPMPASPPAESGEVEMLDALILATRSLMEWLEERESSVAGTSDVREGLIGVEDMLPDGEAVLDPMPRPGHRASVTFGDLRAIRKALVGEQTHAMVMTSAEERAALASTPAPPQAQDFAKGAEAPAAWRDVLAERQRQIASEGWTPEHDDDHVGGELARAAACYAAHASAYQRMPVGLKTYQMIARQSASTGGLLKSHGGGRVTLAAIL